MATPAYPHPLIYAYEARLLWVLLRGSIMGWSDLRSGVVIIYHGVGVYSGVYYGVRGSIMGSIMGVWS